MKDILKMARKQKKKTEMKNTDKTARKHKNTYWKEGRR